MEQNEELEVRRWTRWHTCHPAKRRVALVLEILRGDTTAAEAARKHGLTVAEVEDWRDRFLSGQKTPSRASRFKKVP